MVCRQLSASGRNGIARSGSITGQSGKDEADKGQQRKCTGYKRAEAKSAVANIVDCLLEGVEFELSGDFLKGQ